MSADMKIALFLGLAAAFAIAVIVDLARELWEATEEDEEKEDEW